MDSDFSTSPEAAGWRLKPTWMQERDRKPAEGQWLEEEGQVSVRAGSWESPRFPVRPGAWYHVTLRAAATGMVQPGMAFYDAQGQELVSDHNTGMDPSDELREHEFFVRARSQAAEAVLRLGVYEVGEVRATEVRVEEASPRQVLAWSDEVYREMPAVTYQPPAERWRHLPRTREAIERGGPLRVVMLGDSIINDTASSPFDLLLQREQPKADLDLIISIRGGTGCWYYRHQNRVQQYVLDHQPDLVIIGGISHRTDIAAIRAVVEQIQAAGDAEILLMTGAVAPEFKSVPNGEHMPAEEVHAAILRYAQELEALAEETQAGFFNLRAAWNEYVASSGRDPQWFRRDEVHANSRARQVLAHLMARQLAVRQAR